MAARAAWTGRGHMQAGPTRSSQGASEGAGGRTGRRKTRTPGLPAACRGAWRARGGGRSSQFGGLWRRGAAGEGRGCLGGVGTLETMVSWGTLEMYVSLCAEVESLALDPQSQPPPTVIARVSVRLRSGRPYAFVQCAGRQRGYGPAGLGGRRGVADGLLGCCTPCGGGGSRAVHGRSHCGHAGDLHAPRGSGRGRSFSGER